MHCTRYIQSRCTGSNWQLDPLGISIKLVGQGTVHYGGPVVDCFRRDFLTQKENFWYNIRKSNTLLELELEYLRMKLFGAPSELFTMLIFMYLELQGPMQVAGLVRDSPNVIA